MPIGETLAEQRHRLTLAAHLMCAASILQAEWEANDDVAESRDLIRPGLLARLLRICRTHAIDRIAMGHVLMAEAQSARQSDLCYLEWLTKEVELSLAPYAAGIIRYIRQQRDLLPREQAIGLAYLGIAFGQKADDRAKLATLLSTLTQGIPLRLVSPVLPDKSEYLTNGQRAVLERVTELGDAFFANERLGPLRPRLFPLLGGATGAGKTFLIRKAAARLKAAFITITAGEWIPQGAAAEYEATCYSILHKVAAHDRVIVCIDELDKVRLDSDSTWGRSVASDLWRTLDHELPIAAYLRSPRSTLHGVDISEDQLTQKVPSTLWFVGIGTWQANFETSPTIGFSSQNLVTRVLEGKTIQRSQTIPVELLLRFHPDVIQLTYPTPEETEEVFRACGLTEAAQNAGLKLDPQRHDWRGGMRSVEALWAEIAILRRRHHARISNE